MLHDDWLLQASSAFCSSWKGISAILSRTKAAILLCVNIAATCITPSIQWLCTSHHRSGVEQPATKGPAGHMKLVRLVAS